MSEDEVRRALVESLNDLLEHDSYLLVYDVNERSISHKLAEYLHAKCGDLDVDCEYNRNMDEPKRVDALVRELPEQELAAGAEDTHAIAVYPDVIVHRRGSNEENVLVVEMKKAGGRSPQLDCAKLRGFSRHPYRYRNAALVIVGWNKGPQVLIRWLLNGHTGGKLEFDDVVVA